MNRLLTVLLLIPVFGCAFRENAEVQPLSTQYRVGRYAGVRPADLKMALGNMTYSLIDMIDLPSGDYELDNTVLGKGTVDYLYDYPKFADTQCEGLGYSVSYEPKRRSITTNLKLVLFVNRKQMTLDHFVASPKDVVQVAVYGDYAPLSEFVDLEKTPDEFVKNFLPSNKCHYLCAQARVKPARKLIFEPGRIDCTFWIYGWDGQMPTTTFTDDLSFSPVWIEQAQLRDAYLGQLQKCDAVRSNEDLAYYYQQAAGECGGNTQRIIMREWYFVEQKVPYKSPVYSIQNLSQIVKSTAATQNDSAVDHPVNPMSYWSN